MIKYQNQPKELQNKRVRQGSLVKVIAGNDKGVKGKVLRRTHDRVVVQGVNVRKKHVKKGRDQKGSMLNIEVPIHVSNVAPCNEAEEAVKLKVRMNEQGERELVYKDEGQERLFRPVKKSK